MVALRCSVPGCQSRRDQGKLFKQFPKEEELASQWLRNLPLTFKVRKTSAICEDHFDIHQFERQREDGKKKLKRSAVPYLKPSYQLPERKILGNLTNFHQSKPVSAEHSYSSPIARPSSTLQSLSPTRIKLKENKSLCAQDLPHPASTVLGTPPATAVKSSPDLTNQAAVTENVTGGDCCCSVTVEDVTELSSPDVTELCRPVTPVKQEPSIRHLFEAVIDFFDRGSQVTHIEDTPEVQILDEVTGLFKTVEAVVPSAAQEVSLAEGVPQGDQVQFQLFLDEKTGKLKFCDIPSASDAAPVYTGQMAYDSIMEIITVQQSRLAEAEKALEEKDRLIDELRSGAVFAGSFMEGFKEKYDAVRKAKERSDARCRNLQNYVEKNVYSPRLSESRMKRLLRKSNRGLKWETEDIQIGLILKMKCGTSGYSAVVGHFPFLPSARTLREAVQFIKFDSGVLHEVFDLMETMAKGLADTEKDCQVVMDELAIEEGVRYCNSLKKFVGMCTLPTHTGRANKALVVMLAGIKRRWKIAVAVYFTSKKSEEAKKRKNENPTGMAYSNILDTIITKAENIGLKVCGITSDMGSENMAFWKAKGVTGQGGVEVISSYPNPVRPKSQVFVLPDEIHLMKALKTMLETNVTIELPDDVVREEGLSSAVVDYRHIEDLHQFELNCEVKVAFRLREENVHCKKQFKKMNVGTTKAVVNHRTGIGLNMLALEKKDTSYNTTAWFIILVNTFFALVTCRHRGLAMSLSNKTAYEKALSLIRRVDYIFTFMKVGEKGSWKPVQRGMRVLCASLLGLTDHFLIERKYDYLMLGRFSSDCIENLFSLIRMCQPIPHAAACLQCLKVVTLAQFSEAIRGSSYDYEESSPLPSTDFLGEARRRAKERALERSQKSIDELFSLVVRKLEIADYNCVNSWERSVIYDMAGSVIKAILSSNMVVCDICINAAKWKGEGSHPAAFVTEMKEFTLLRGDNGEKLLQIYVSDTVYKAILTAEITFRMYRHQTIAFQHVDVKEYFVQNLMYVWSGSNIPKCHNLERKILSVFFDGRLKEFGKILKNNSNANASKPLTVERSSKSVAMRAAANGMVVGSVHQVRVLR